MKISRITGAIALTIILFASACQKETSPDNFKEPTNDDDECIVGQGLSAGDIIPGRYIVAYSINQSNRAATSSMMANASEGVLSRNSIDESKMTSVFAGEPGGFVATLSKAEADRLKTDPAIEMVEPDRVVALASCFTVAEPRLITWNVTRVGYGDGRGKTAWILDTGIDMDHPDLTVDAARSKSFISGQTSPNDENGHGTHVAGIIGANNNAIGVLGVASGATLVSLRVLGANGIGTLSSIIQALAYVNTNAKAGDVVNMSFGEDVNSPTLNQEVQNTAGRGIYIAIAAGNNGEAANKYSPGNTNGTNIYTVSAIDSLDNFAGFSNYGNDVVDFAAPGVQILSTFTNGTYAYMSGTSMAAPHVAGLLLLKGNNIGRSGTAKNDPDNAADPIAHY